MRPFSYIIACMDTGLAILISTIMATAGWFYTSRQQRQIDRRQHTYRIIIRQQDDPKFADSLDRIRTLLDKEKVPHPDDDHNREDIDKLDYLLNHYEFLSAAIWAGDVDENLMKSCEYSRITKLFGKMGTYINDCRDFREQPSMFENLDHLAARWVSNKLTPAEMLFETITLRPCRQYPSWVPAVDRWYARAAKVRRRFRRSN